MRKENENVEIMRYKFWLVQECCTNLTLILKTYLPVVKASKLYELISQAAYEKLNLCMMNVVRAYLYGSFDSDIYKELFKGFNFPGTYNSSSWEEYSSELNKSLYGLKQSGQMWYSCPREYLLNEGYKMTSFVHLFLWKGLEMNLL